jgi:DNA-binding PadR family transcriptional regulator
MRRGDIRRAILTVLAEGPANGYEVMSRLEARSGGMWRPSPGSVYPTLQMLEDEGLARSVESGGTRTYELTDEGRTQAEAAGEEPGFPWDDPSGADQHRVLREAVMQTNVAAMQVAHAGRAEQLDRAVEIVQRARKELYGLLAEG